MTCFGVRGATLIALCVFFAPLALSGQGASPTPPSVPLSADAPFTVAVSTTTIEGGPVYVADNGPQGAGFRVINGGVRNLANGSAHAATNAETQFLIAGTPDGLAQATEAAKEAGIRKVIPLDVAAAFHTPLMDDAAIGFAEYLQSIDFAAPSAPVVSNEDGVAYSDGDGWKARLVTHLVQPVRWTKVMHTIDTLGPSSLREVGPGTTLTALAKRCLPESEWVKN